MELFIVYFVAIGVIIPILIIGGVVGPRMRSVFKTHSSHFHEKDAFNAATDLLQDQKIEDVAIVEVNSVQTNNYNAKHRVIKLSSNVVRSTSITACGVATYAVGAAILEHKKPKLIRFKEIVHLLTTFVAKCFIPIMIIGALITFFIGFETFGNIICWVITCLYLLSLFVELFLQIIENKIKRLSLALHGDYKDFSRDNEKSIKRVISYATNISIVEFADSIVYFLRVFFIAFKPADNVGKM